MNQKKPKQQRNGHSNKLFLLEKEKVCKNCKSKNCKRVHGIASGMVQGVFFRAYTVKLANELGLKGWVKNTFDGSVEFIAEGNELKLKEFIEKMRKGSPASTVENLEISWSKAENKFNEFKTIY